MVSAMAASSDVRPQNSRQFGGEMLGVASRATVAAGQNLAAIDQAIGHRLDGGGDGGGHHFNSVQLGLGAVFRNAC